MPDKDTDVRELKQRQLAQEQAASEALEHADTDADAAKHERRADKARYLRQKLQQRERSEQDVSRDD